MRKVTLVLAMIPSERRTTAAGFNSGAIAVNIVDGDMILIVEKLASFGIPSKLNFEDGSCIVPGMS
jgi:hypothetical protein